MKVISFFFIIFALTFALTFTQAYSSQPPTPIENKLLELKEVNTNSIWLQESISKKEEALKKLIDSGNDNEEKANLENEIKNFKKKLSQNEKYFFSLSSGIDISEIEQRTADQQNIKRDIVSELQELITPVIDGLRRVSKKPRKIEALRKEIEHIRERIDLYQEGKKHLDAIVALITGTTDTSASASGTKLIEKINENKIKLQEKIKELSFEISEKERSLNNELSKNKTFVEALSELAKEFFGRRGQNLLISVLVSLFVYFSITYFKRSRYFKELLQRKNILRSKNLILFLYNVVASSLAIIFFLLSLYFLNDWPLLTIFSLFIIGIFWSIKSFIPKFLNEGKMILNLGTVKEGEIITYNGIHWLVDNLGLHTTLINPLLDGGKIRVKIKDLIPMNSRAPVEEEMWFPSKKGDYILMSDGTFGKVIKQTPEYVVLSLDGGTLKNYSSPQFLTLSPQNLSYGFKLEAKLSLDYSLQSQIINIPQIIYLALKDLFRLEIEQKKIISIDVYFREMAESALIITTTLYCDGPSMCCERLKIIPRLNLALIEIANQHKWNIPLNQMLVHLSKEKI
ncbi:MAG: hypothetical protein HQK49_06195 [Oligoflexia bacterium]|nr:hypothetical protein [Oligoflexia bacterium]